MRDITGNRSRTELKREAISGVIRSGMLGFGTGAINFPQSIVQGFAYFTPSQTLTSLGNAVKNFSINTKESFAQGVNVRNIGQIEASVGGLNEAVGALHGIR